jgi:DNA polymerase I
MKLPILKYTDNKKRKNKSAEKNPSTDAEVLEQYAKLNGFCAHISKQRTLLHLKSTFLDGFLKQVGDDQRIHTSYLLFGTVTGRPSSKSPNLNNIPKTSTASDIKDLYLADEGKWLMELDGKAMEFRVWASMSGDPRMIRDIELGLDIHKAMAGVSYFGRSLPDKGDITPEQFAALVEGVTKEQRETAKTEVVFGPIYGRGIEAIAKALGCSKQEAGRIQNELFKRYRVGASYLGSLKAMCRRDGYVQSLFGRRRRLPNIISVDMGLRSDAERQATNSPIQSVASDVVLMAGNRIDSMLQHNSMKTDLLLTVYDSLLYHIPEDELSFMFGYAPVEFIKHLEELRVKLDVEVKIGKRWGSLVAVDWRKPWNEEFDRVKKQVEENELKFKQTYGL